jgi:tRNA threonylcarbamoyl adenosine modification protein YeaZ
LILAFDTSAAHCAAVIVSGDTVLARRHEEMNRGQAERLFPLLEEMLGEAGTGWRDLRALAVGTGPGNFTGLRVAVAAARGLALATGLPAFGVDGFAARAEGAPGPSLVCIAAPRGAVHVRRIGGDPDDAVATMTVDEACALAGSEGLRLVGEAVGAPPALPLAEAIARVARRRLAAGETPARPAPV